MLHNPNATHKTMMSTEPRRALKKLWKKHHQLVAVTGGAKGCWYLSAEDPARPRHQPAFKVKVVDTTGCGCPLGQIVR